MDGVRVNMLLLVHRVLLQCFATGKTVHAWVCKALLCQLNFRPVERVNNNFSANTLIDPVARLHNSTSWDWEPGQCRDCARGIGPSDAVFEIPIRRVGWRPDGVRPLG